MPWGREQSSPFPQTTTPIWPLFRDLGFSINNMVMCNIPAMEVNYQVPYEQK